MGRGVTSGVSVDIRFLDWAEMKAQGSGWDQSKVRRNTDPVSPSSWSLNWSSSSFIHTVSSLFLLFTQSAIYMSQTLVLLASSSAQHGSSIYANGRLNGPEPALKHRQRENQPKWRNWSLISPIQVLLMSARWWGRTPEQEVTAGG